MNPGYIKSLRIIYFSLAAGLVMFSFTSLFVNFSVGPFLGTGLPVAKKTPYIIGLIVFTGFTIMAYRIINAKKLSALQELHTLEDKLLAWRELNVIRGALIEAPAFMAITMFLLLGLHVMLVWPLVSITTFWLTLPNRDSLLEEAKFSSSQTQEFDRMNQS